MKQLPPIFKVNNSIKNNNQKYYYEKVSNVNKVKEVNTKKDLTIGEKIDKIFKTKGYAFNVPVTIEFAGKRLDTYLALKKNDSIITLDNEIIPISTITSLEIKKVHRNE